MKIVEFQGEIYPSHFRFKSEYEQMKVEDIPEGAIVGIALSFMAKNDGSGELIYNNIPLFWEQGSVIQKKK